MISDQLDRFEKIAEMVEELPKVIRKFVRECEVRPTEAQGNLDRLLDLAQTVEDEGIVIDEIYQSKGRGMG